MHILLLKTICKLYLNSLLNNMEFIILIVYYCCTKLLFVNYISVSKSIYYHLKQSLTILTITVLTCFCLICLIISAYIITKLLLNYLMDC